MVGWNAGEDNMYRTMTLRSCVRRLWDWSSCGISGRSSSIYIYTLVYGMELNLPWFTFRMSSGAADEVLQQEIHRVGLTEGEKSEEMSTMRVTPWM